MRPAGLRGGGALSPSFGFNEGFDSYTSPGEFEGLPSVVPRALSFIRANRSRPMFVFMQGFDTDGQYMPPGGLTQKFVDRYHGSLTGTVQEEKKLREEGVVNTGISLQPADVRLLRALYDEKVERADGEIATFLSGFSKLHISRPTVFVFTSDYGEEFYEHGRIDHGMTLYDEVLHVPLIIALPGQTKGRIITDQVRNIDIMPTLLALTGTVPPAAVRAQMEGVSLIPTMEGAHQHLNLFAETSYRYATFLQSIRTWDGWKLIYDTNSILLNHVYDLNSDKGEQHDLTNTGNPMVSRMMSSFADLLGRIRADNDRLHR